MAVFPNSMPYDTINIIDQSQYTEPVAEQPMASIPDGPIAFCPFVSPRGYGEDNKLVYMSPTMLSKYGTPNLKKYGLSLYLANRVANAGGTVLGMRVMPDSAKAASYTMYYRFEINEVKGAYPTYGTIEHNGSYIAPIKFTRYKAGEGLDSPLDEEVAFLASLDKDSDGKEILTTPKIWNDLNKFHIEPEGANTGMDPDGDGTETLHNTEGETRDYQFIYINGLKFYITKDGPTLYLSTLGSQENYYADNYGGCGIAFMATTDDSLSLYKSTKIHLTNNPTDDENYSDYKEWFTLSSKAKGEFANAFKFRFELSQTMSTDTDKYYNFAVYDGANKLDNVFTVSFNPEATYNNESMYIEDVIEEYSNYITAKVVNDIYTDLESHVYEKYGIKIDAKSVDFIGGEYLQYSIFDGPNPYTALIELDSTENLTIVSGTSFTGGVDGWASGDYDFDNDKFAEVLARAYGMVGNKNEISDLIYDQYRYPFQFIFAPSYNKDVVASIHNLINNNRNVTHAAYFIKRTNTYAEAREVVKANDTELQYTWRERIYPEWAEVRDPYTNKKTYFPSVYFNAYFDITHWLLSKETPLAGRSNYMWSGFNAGTMRPYTSKSDEIIANHKAGINTMIEDGVGNATPYEQITAQTIRVNSALSEINNAMVLSEMVKIALKIAQDNRWSNIGDQLETYKKTVENTIAVRLKNCYDTVEVISEQESLNGAGKNRIYCRINVKFKGIFKGVTYEFYILEN